MFNSTENNEMVRSVSPFQDYQGAGISLRQQRKEEETTPKYDPDQTNTPPRNYVKDIRIGFDLKKSIEKAIPATGSFFKQGSCQKSGSLEPQRCAQFNFSASKMMIPDRDHYLLGSNLKSPRGTQRLHCTNQKNSNYARDMNKESFIQKSIQLEDEFHQAQTTIRKKEGTYIKQIAILEQQMNQMRTELSDAQDRSNKQKELYEQILKAINDQFNTNGEMNQNAFLLCLSNVQYLISEASKVLEGGCGASKQIETLSDRLIEQRNSQLKDQLSAQKHYHSPHHQLYSKAQAQGETREKLTQTTCKQDNKESQTDIGIDEEDKIKKLELEISSLKERDSKLKSLHADELKYITDMNSHEINLYESKIKQLQGTNNHLKQKLNRFTTNDSASINVNERLSLASFNTPQQYNNDYSPSRASSFNKLPFGALTLAGANLGGSTSRLHSSALREEAEVRRQQSLTQSNNKFQSSSYKSSQINDLVVESLPYLYIAPSMQNIQSEENKNLKVQLKKLQHERSQEFQVWQQKKIDLESTVGKFTRMINENLKNYKDSMEKHKIQLSEKEQENKVLQSQMATIKLQVQKLEKIQQSDLLSRSRSSSKHRANFRFGCGEAQDLSNVNNFSPKSGACNQFQRYEEELRVRGGQSYLKKSIQDFKLRKCPLGQIDLFEKDRPSKATTTPGVFSPSSKLNKELQTPKSDLEGGVIFQTMQDQKNREQTTNDLSPFIINYGCKVFEDLPNITIEQQREKSHVQHLSDRKRRVKASLKSRSNSKSNTLRNLRTQIQQNKVTVVNECKANEKIINSESQGLLTQRTLGTQNPNGNESEYGKVGNDLNLRDLAATFKSLKSGVGANVKEVDQMYNSIQINQSPIKLRLDEVDNQSCGSRKQDSPGKFFGDISPKKKTLISKLAPAESWELHSKENIEFNTINLQKIEDHYCGISNHDRTNSSQLISPIKQEAKKSKMHENLKILSPGLEKQRYLEYEPNVQIESSIVPQTADQHSLSSNSDSRSNTSQDKQAFMSQIQEQHKTQSRKHHHGSNSNIPQYQTPLLINEQIMTKFEQLYSKISRRDKKLNKLKDENKRLTSIRSDLYDQLRQLTDELAESSERRHELLLENQKIEYRLKQVSIILSDQSMNNQINLIVDDQSKESMRQSLQDLKNQQRHIQQMETQKSLQKIFSARTLSKYSESAKESSFGDSGIVKVRETSKDARQIEENDVYEEDISEPVVVSVPAISLSQMPPRSTKNAYNQKPMNPLYNNTQRAIKQKLIIPAIDLSNLQGSRQSSLENKTESNENQKAPQGSIYQNLLNASEFNSKRLSSNQGISKGAYNSSRHQQSQTPNLLPHSNKGISPKQAFKPTNFNVAQKPFTADKTQSFKTKDSQVASCQSAVLIQQSKELQQKPKKHTNTSTNNTPMINAPYHGLLTQNLQTRSSRQSSQKSARKEKQKIVKTALPKVTGSQIIVPNRSSGAKLPQPGMTAPKKKVQSRNQQVDFNSITSQKRPPMTTYQDAHSGMLGSQRSIGQSNNSASQLKTYSATMTQKLSAAVIKSPRLCDQQKSQQQKIFSSKFQANPRVHKKSQMRYDPLGTPNYNSEGSDSNTRVIERKTYNQTQFPENHIKIKINDTPMKAQQNSNQKRVAEERLQKASDEKERQIKQQLQNLVEKNLQNRQDSYNNQSQVTERYGDATPEKQGSLVTINENGETNIADTSCNHLKLCSSVEDQSDTSLRMSLPKLHKQDTIRDPLDLSPTKASMFSDIKNQLGQVKSLPSQKNGGINQHQYINRTAMIRQKEN